MNKKVNLVIRSFVLTSVVVYGLAGFIVYSELKPHNLEFYIFDIGQGDSILIKTPSHQTILVDGGPDNSVVYKLGKYLPFYQRQIDFVILTHADADHLVGLLEVLRRYEVENVITTNFIHNSSYSKEWHSRLDDFNVLIVDQPKILSLGDVELFFINPGNSKLAEDVNNASLVFKLEYQDAAALFMGDFENEESFVTSEFNVSADFLKVGHHGAGNANNLKFLTQVRPKFAAISVGANNKFGHPAPDVVSNLSGLGAEVLRTDLSGDIHFISHGEDFYLSP